LVDLLSFVEHHINKIIHRVEPEYGFRFVGIDQQSEKLLADIRNIDLTTHRTIDELRAEDGEEPLNEEWSKIVLNTNAVQLILADKAQKLQEKQMAQQAAMGGPPSGPGAGHPMTSQKTGTGGGAKNKSTGDSDLFKYTDGQEQTVDEKEAKQFGKLRKAMRDGTVTISIK
jgi:hypothetical protein